METKLDQFKKIFQFLNINSGPHEATFDHLISHAKNDQEILNWLLKSFQQEVSLHKKENFALIAVASGRQEPFKSFLLAECEWTLDDFEDE